MNPFQKPAFCLAVLLFIGSRAPLCPRDLPSADIEDDSSLRLLLRDEWFLAAPDRILAKASQIHNLPGGGRVQVRVEATSGEIAVILARELTGPDGRTMGTFPGWAQGSWLYVRRRSDGAPLRILVFPRSDSRTYLEFRPLGTDRCLMDMVLYDAYLSWSLPVAIPFERLFTLPMETVYAAMGEKFKRRYFDPDPENYRDLRLFISRLRSRLPELSFRDDGAIDAQGRYVFIETQEAQDGKGGLNCSGFAKWVVDGVLRPLSGQRLDITTLKQPFGQRGSSFTAVWENLRDPFFGLDWTRNLASQAWSAFRSPDYSNPADFEVRDLPFSQLIVRGQSAVSQGPSSGPAPKNYPAYLENSGFGVEGLRPLLYSLAIDEPGRIYLASVNNEMGPPSTPSNPRGLPRMRQHFHVAVLIPYFDEYSGFQVAVFESAEETRFTRFLARYPGHNINLVRIPVEGPFDP
ncbi:MAG: hypothetical protein LBU19_02810 [Treponema sp.]|jgi:hypothetical protein|nr:hypothetical protein [Treponema sp.]